MSAPYRPTFADRLRRDIVRVRTADDFPLALTHLAPLPAPRDAGRPPVALLVHGFGQNRYLFDMPGRSFAAHLALAGFHVYLLELRGHGLSRVRGGRYATAVIDYAELDLPAAVDAVRARHDGPLALVGHSMGGVTCLVSPDRVKEKCSALVAIAAPTHVGRDAWGTRTVARVGAGLLRALGPTKLGGAFDTGRMASVLRHVLPVMDAKLPWPVHIWHPGETERALLRRYLEIAFEPEPRGVCFDFGRWTRGRVFDRTPGGESMWSRLRHMTLPALFVAGAEDKLTPPDSVQPGFGLVGSADKTWRVFGDDGGAKPDLGRYGHIDLLLGQHAPLEVWPFITTWLRGRMTGL